MFLLETIHYQMLSCKSTQFFCSTLIETDPLGRIVDVICVSSLTVKPMTGYPEAIPIQVRFDDLNPVPARHANG